MFPSIADVLALPAVRTGAPQVVAGDAGLQRRVRWVHSAEVPDIAVQLQGGELVLSTGIALPADHAGLTDYIHALADAGAVGLMIEMGRRYTGRLPKSLLAAADDRDFALVTLADPTPFVNVTEAVHAMIIDAQLGELQATQQMHHRFTELSVDGAEPTEVVRQVSQLSGCPTVLETLTHQVVVYDPAGRSPRTILHDWEPRSRRIQPAERTAYDVTTRWLVTLVGARGHDWGRLVLLCDEPPAPRVTVLAERAAATLAVNRLVTREVDSLERQSHISLLTALRDHQLPAEEIALRSGALGVPLVRRRLTALVVRTAGTPVLDTPMLTWQAQLRDLAETVASACRTHGVPALVGSLDDTQIGALVSMPGGGREAPAAAERLDALARTIHDRARDRRSLTGTGLVVGAGHTVQSPAEARRTLAEAIQVAEAAALRPATAVLHRVGDIHVRGLLNLLRDDARLQTFVERELAPLLRHDAQHQQQELLPAVRAYLECGRNKSKAATLSHLSRPSFYDRLTKAQTILDLDLDDAEICLSLHLAVLARDAMRGSVPTSAPSRTKGST